MKLNLSLKKKTIKTLSHKAKALPMMNTPNIAGRTDIPESMYKQCEETK